MKENRKKVLNTISEQYEDSESSSIHKRKMKKGKLPNISIDFLKPRKI